MINILMATRDKPSMSALKAGLDEYDVQTTWVETGRGGLSLIADSNFDLVVSDQNLKDMTGLEFIKVLIRQNPMVNCAVVSSLGPADFHEDSEGFGVLMQLPAGPGREFAGKLLGLLKNIMAL